MSRAEHIEAGFTAVHRGALLSWVVWIVPLVALAVAGYWVYRAMIGQDQMIVMHFANGAGLRPDQSSLRYRGVQAGLVRRITYPADAGRVDVTVQLNRDAMFLARQGSVFWIVRPKFTGSGISGLDAIVSGSYIDSMAGSSDQMAREFDGLGERPLTDYGGLDLVLVADRIHDLDPGAEVQYRGLAVGEVRRVQLSVDGKQVQIDIHIDSAFKHLVRGNSKFWAPQGLDFHFSLFGESRLRAPSLADALGGAVAFVTPEAPGERVEKGHRFELYDEPAEDWFKTQPRTTKSRRK